MSEKIFSLLCGIIFGIGLVISGMTNPEKVIGFLSITYNWDASLIFVMGGAILVFAPAFYFLKEKEPFYSQILGQCQVVWKINELILEVHRRAYFFF